MSGPYPAMEPVDFGELRRIFADAFRQDPDVFNKAWAKQTGNGYELTPAERALGTGTIDALRQQLPWRVADTRAADWLPDQTPDWIRNLPLGGYSAERTQALQDIHESDPEVADRSYRRGFMPNPEPGTIGEVEIGASNRRKLAQMAGMATGDLLGKQGLQHLWWLINAAPAVASVAQLQSIHRAGEEIGDDGRWIKGYHNNAAQTPIESPLLKSHGMRMAATIPAWMAINFATGAFGRQPGFGASVPSEMDPREATNPVAETLSRVFLNRGGKMLPYDEFVQERPDVSKGEYEAYKAYQYGNPWPLKATADGINGPEINFLGKSIPLLTGILPAVAGVVAARHGARQAALKLANDPDGNLIEKRAHTYNTIQKYKAELSEAERNLKNPEFDGDRGMLKLQKAGAQQILDKALPDYKTLNNTVEGETLKQVLTWSSGALVGTGLLGSTLESIRRSLRGEAPQEPDPLVPQTASPGGTPLPPASTRPPL
jgi:hypothetical protein